MKRARIKKFPIEASTYRSLAKLWEKHRKQMPNLRGFDHGKKAYRFFCHLLVSSLVQLRALFEGSKKGYIPIPKRFIQDKYRYLDPNHLVQAGLIDIDRSYTKGKEPRKYRVKPNILKELFKLLHRKESGPLVDLLTGKPWGENPNDTTLPANDLPKLVQDAIDTIETCYINQDAAWQHIETLKEAWDRTGKARDEFRYRNDLLAYKAVTHNCKFTQWPDIVSFKPTYTMQSTGRVSTPLQSASKPMKASAYESIPNLYNYDLSSSQVVIIYHAMLAEGIECEWLDKFLSDKRHKERYAKAVGVSIESWKSCLCALLMGAALPTNTTFKANQQCAILNELRAALPNATKDELKETLKRLRKSFKQLMGPLKQWQQSLENKASQNKGLTNALSIERSYKEFKGNTGSMVAHYLQGQEAYFIHTLTTLATEFSFQVIGNEHDGLITIGAIPPEAIQKAGALTGMHYCELREKPFC